VDGLEATYNLISDKVGWLLVTTTIGIVQYHNPILLERWSHQFPFIAKVFFAFKFPFLIDSFTMFDVTIFFIIIVLQGHKTFFAFFVLQIKIFLSPQSIII
jgi:hypothetical protein